MLKLNLLCVFTDCMCGRERQCRLGTLHSGVSGSAEAPVAVRSACGLRRPGWALLGGLGELAVSHHQDGVVAVGAQ